MPEIGGSPCERQARSQDEDPPEPRGVLRSEGEFTTLGRELEVIEAYLDIERERFEQRLRVSIDVPARRDDVSVKMPPTCAARSRMLTRP